MATPDAIGLIQSVIARWSHLLDDRDYEAMSRLLLPDAVMEFPSGKEFRGRDVIRDAVAGVQPELPVKHLTGVPDVEIVGDDVAVARADMVTIAVEADGSVRLQGASRYFDRLRRVDGQWLFESRQMRSPGAPPVVLER